MRGIFANAMTLNEAKKLFLKGEYEKVLPTFKVYAQKYPSNANYNQWYGVCLYETGKVEESKNIWNMPTRKKLQKLQDTWRK